MSLAEALYVRLTAQLTETVYPLRLPEDATLPAVVYQQVSGPREYSHDGEAGPHRARWQMTAWGESYEDAKATAASVVTAVSAWDDDSGTYVERVVAFIENEIDLYDEAAQLYYVPVDAVVLFETD